MSRLSYDDDGNSFLCTACGASVPRTRSNPYPEHRCKRMLWMDDTKPAPHGCVVARTFDDAYKLLMEQDWDVLYLDHDLGETWPARTGYDLLKLLVEAGRVPPQVECISMNPVGRKRIADLLESYRRLAAREGTRG